MKAIASAIILSCLVSVFVPAAYADAPQDAATGEIPPARRFEPPYPFTVDELWAQMLKLAALPEGHVTRADVERTFSIKLLEMQESVPPKHPTYRIMHQDDDWYFSTGITEKSKTESSYFFTWGNSSGDSPEHPSAGMCITPAMVESGMKATGWTFADRKIQHTDPFTGKPVHYKREERNYRKGRHGVLWVNIKRGCLIEFRILSEEHPHFEWTIYD